MARSARKPERETDEFKQASTKPDKTITTPPAGAAADTAAEAASTTSSKPDIEFAGFQTGQFESLRAVLEKRSEASASRAPLRRNLPRCGSRFTRSISSFWFRH